MTRTNLNKEIKLFLLLTLLNLTIIIPNISMVVFTQGATQTQYFPLGLSTSWVFDSTDNNASWTTRRYIGEEWEFLGLTFTIYYNEEHDGVWQNKMWLSKTKNSLVWWGFEDEYAKVIAKKGLTYVVEPPEIGASEGGITKADLIIKDNPSEKIKVDFQGEYTIEAIETLTLPAGVFEDCIKVHEMEITPDGTADFYVWYAPAIGPVKFSYPLRNNRTDLLTEYTIVDDDPYETWFMPKVPYVIIGTAVGLVVLIGIIVTFVIIRRKKRRTKNVEKDGE
ncbi:MAG: hypothetical protein GF308_10430 [Candidatus Heimdallarchaeota archaeon]|nr:hypothetical protein [Candidatus Heimdallarchaeota archaeon]